jgi:1,4-dihydroxy-2-naphthoate octaprenyltransferase
MAQGPIDGALLSSPAGAPSLPGVAPGSLAAWSMALRPRSLAVAVSPVLAAVALVWSRGQAIDALLVALVLAAAVMIQSITNLQNDVGYTVRGAERSGTRIGLPRATGLGLLTPAQVRLAIVAAIVVAVLLGLPIVALRGTPALAIGLASILAALAYMGGPRPIAYTPFGEPTVFMFFGLVAVVGTGFALTGSFDDPALWLAGVALGAIATAAIMVNNARDWEHDLEVGRCTLAVVVGRRAMDGLFAAMVLGPLALMLPIGWFMQSAWLALPLVLLPACIRLVRDFAACPPGLPYNGVLFRTFLMELKFAALLAAGALLARLG